MTSDLQSLLAAIVADPSDDVARLVYADCLQEHGNAPRAEFIRLQVEAERHHPHSNTRADLDQRAYALFAEHWVGWWGEVCAALGIEPPVPRPNNRLERLATRAGLRPNPGAPYVTSGFGIVRRGARPRDSELVTFHSGFPDRIGPALAFCPHWSRISPLDAVTFHSSAGAFDCNPFRSVRRVTIIGQDLVALNRIFRSEDIEQLREVCLQQELSDPDRRQLLQTQFADDLADALTAPRVRQLKRLAIPLWNDRAVSVVANSESLRGLEALDVSVLHDRSDDVEGAGRRLAILARSPHLVDLKELTVRGWTDANGLAAVLHSPPWTNLRKLELHGLFWAHTLAPLDADTLYNLDDLTLDFIRFGRESLGHLLRSPLLKRVRHLSLRGSDDEKCLLPALAEIPDLEQIETYALSFFGAVPTELQRALRAKFGDRVRFLSTD